MEAVVCVVSILALAVGTTLLVAARRPDTFRVTRTVSIAAPPERLFALINDLRSFNRWNPYALRETAGTGEYVGHSAGAGAVYSFAGPKSGTGRIEIVGSTPVSCVQMRLVMTKPMRVDNAVSFTLTANGPVTDATWTMTGCSGLAGKVLSLLIDCDRMVGRDFEQGLANLKRLAEQPG